MMIMTTSYLYIDILNRWQLLREATPTCRNAQNKIYIVHKPQNKYFNFNYTFYDIYINNLIENNKMCFYA